MEMWIIWLIAGACLLIVEVLTQMMWALCLSVGALCAMACALCGISFGWQCTILIIAGLITYIAVLPVFKRRQSRAAQHRERTGMEALLGRRAIVTDPIFPDRLGRARIDGDNWQVKAPGTRYVIEPGAEVIVTAYDSIILTVEPQVKKQS